MCGVVALIALRDGRPSRAALEQMTDAVAHRGPDARGVVVLDEAGGERPAGASDWRVALGHRRLSIVDLSDAGRQPMRRGTSWVSYNGEIYNYVELRSELEALGERFTTASDTEVLLAAYARWGTGAFARMRGMWGVALYDGARRVLVLSRDRVGIKPLYLARTTTSVAVVSEPKQLAALPGFSLAPDDDAVRLYLATGWEDHHRSMFAGVTPLVPGTFVEVDLTGAVSRPVSYWAPEAIRADIADRDEAAHAIRATFDDALRVHMRSDVPVGCALSGGIDSSAIACSVPALGFAPMDAFSATFPGFEQDERHWIDKVAARAAMRTHFVTPDPARCLAELDTFLWHHDEPVGSLAQYAAWAVARLTREAGVPVSLNGQGGDEVLSAYWESYAAWLAGAARARSLMPIVRELLGAAMPSGNGQVYRELPMLTRRLLERLGQQALKVKGALPDVRGRVAGVLRMSNEQRRVHEIREQYLPRLLKWDDRNFMAFSVEGRYPFLDHVFIETALRLTRGVLYRDGWTKVPLREATRDRMPREILERRTKVGFEIPQGAWLRGPFAAALDDVVARGTHVTRWVERTELAALASRVEKSKSPRRADHQALFRALCVERWANVFFSQGAVAPRAAA